MILIPIYAVLFFSLFGGLFIRAGIPGYFSIVTECLIYLICLITLIDIRKRHHFFLHLFYFLIIFSILSIVSNLYNDSAITRGVFSFRRLFRFYFFYLAIINLEIEEIQLKKINSFLTLLLLFQLPVVAYRFSLYGIDERTHGAYSAVHTGTLTTILPIMVIFYVASYYLIYRQKTWYILTGIGFILFSIVGAKRAVAFLYPIQFFSIYHFIFKKRKGGGISTNYFTITFLIVFICVVSGSIFYFNKTLNPEKETGGSVDIGFAFEYAKDYTSRVNVYGYTTGRFSSTIRTFEVLSDAGMLHLFLGFGPGKSTKTLFDKGNKTEDSGFVYEKFKIKYGLTSMTRIIIEYGLVGVLIFSIIIFNFALMCLKYYSIEENPYWKAFAAGSVGFSISMIFFFFAYGHAAFWGDTVPAIYFYLMSVVFTRLNTISQKASAA